MTISGFRGSVGMAGSLRANVPADFRKSSALAVAVGCRQDLMQERTLAGRMGILLYTLFTPRPEIPWGL